MTLLINADVPLAGTLGRLAGWLEGRQTGGKNSKGYQALSLRPKVELGKKRKEASKLGGKLGVSSTSLYQLGRIFQVYNKMKSCFDE